MPAVPSDDPGGSMGGGASVVARGLGHRFATSGGGLTVLEHLDLDVPANGSVAVMGRSGAGKSTLLSLLGGLERPQVGSLVVGGTDVSSLSGDALAAYRRATVGFVFQHFGLLEALTAAENVALACTLAGVRPAARKARATQLLDAVGLADRARHRPHELSGGERQRVAIARALANRPRLVLADEPTGNLDEEAAAQVVALLESLPRERGCTLLVVTHNRALAARADTAYRLDGGRLVPHRPDDVSSFSAPVAGAPDGRSPAPVADAGRTAL